MAALPVSAMGCLLLYLGKHLISQETARRQAPPRRLPLGSARRGCDSASYEEEVAEVENQGVITLAGKWIWIWNWRRCDDGDANRVAERLRSAGCRGAIVKAFDGDRWFAQGPSFRDISRALKSHDLAVGGWGYLYGRDTRPSFRDRNSCWLPGSISSGCGDQRRNASWFRIVRSSGLRNTAIRQWVGIINQAQSKRPIFAE